MQRETIAWLCLLMLAGIARAQEPIVCRTTEPAARKHSAIGDLSGALPIPDYFETALACDSSPDAGIAAAQVHETSEWLESERQLYRRVLAKRKADILVVPFQVQGYGLDRIERALMTADLAQAVGGTGQYKVADPFLAARALGAGMRRLDGTPVRRLADQLGSQRIMFAYVGHDGQHAFTLTIQIEDRSEPTGGATHGAVWQKDWRAVPFSEAETPALVFHRMLPSVLSALPLNLTPAARPPATAAGPAISRFNGTPIEVVNSSAGPASATAILDLLGALSASAAEFSRERLFERALLASLRNGGGDSHNLFLRAYTLMQLERRPAALAQIKGLNTPSTVALRALLNGDLPSASRAISGVSDPLERLLVQIAARDLELTYERKPTIELAAARQVFRSGSSYSQWQTYINVRAGDRDDWSVTSPLVIKQALDSAFPEPGLDARSVVEGSTVARGQSPDEVELDIAIARHLRRAAEKLAPASCCVQHAGEPSSWDLLWLLEGLAEGRMVKSLERTTWAQGLPQRSISALDRYEPFFSGHPLLAAERASTAFSISRDSSDDTRSSWLSQASRNGAFAAYWAQGQGLLSQRATNSMGENLYGSPRIFVDVYGYDFPRRPYWSAWFIGLESNREQQFAFARESLAHSRDDVGAIFLFPPTIRPDPKIAAEFADIRTRFIGNPHRPPFLPGPGNEAGGEPADPDAALRAAIANDPTVWSNYMELGTRLVTLEGRYQDAGKMFLSYPQFKDKNSDDSVELSNDAYEAGSLLYWQGQTELAAPLYQIAADLDTGSEASMTSTLRLDILAGEYENAAAGSLERATRYSSPYAYRDYLSFLHAFGRSEDAWKAFSQVMADFDLPQVWVSALVGQRRQGLDEPAIRKWLLKAEIRGARFRARQFAPLYAIIANTTDRTPPADLGPLVEQLEGPAVAHIEADGIGLSRPRPGNPAEVEELGPMWFHVGETKYVKLPPGTAVKSDFAFFADGYAALKRGNYDVALARFMTMGERYPVDHDADSFALPYFAYAAAKTGDAIKYERVLVSNPRTDFDHWLATALMAGARRDVSAARSALKTAFQLRPNTEYRPILSEYQYAEACEWLYLDTQDPLFSAALLEWVKAHQKIQPTHAWAYAMQYTYEKDPAERLRALALTYYLDPASERIKGAAPAELEQAKNWLGKHNPFRVREQSSEERST